MPVDPSAPRPSLGGVVRRLPLVRRLPVGRIGTVEAGLGAVTEQVARLREQLDAAERRDQSHLDRVTALEVNHELIKGELFDLRQGIESFARSVKPDASLSAAGEVLGDVRVGLAEVARRLRGVERRVVGQVEAATPVAPVSGEPVDEGSVAAEVTSTLFDYVGFEERFRGDPDLINQVLRDRYVDVLREHQPVVDIGCGRGELLQLLMREGLDVVGVEPDPGMAAEARARGIDVRETVADRFLESVADDSLGAVISTHVVEHLGLEDLVGFIELSARKLRPGGVFIAETPNPATLLVLGTHFIMDPTHEWPLHPELMSFLCSSAGFDSVRAEFYSPAHTLHLPLAGPDEEAGALSARVDEGFARLNHILFGPQDYAVFAVAGAGSTTVRDLTAQTGAGSDDGEG